MRWVDEGHGLWSLMDGGICVDGVSRCREDFDHPCSWWVEPDGRCGTAGSWLDATRNVEIALGLRPEWADFEEACFD